LGSAYWVGGEAAALAKALSSAAAQVFVELQATGDKREAQKRSGLSYLLRLQAFHSKNHA